MEPLSIPLATKAFARFAMFKCFEPIGWVNSDQSIVVSEIESDNFSLYFFVVLLL